MNKCLIFTISLIICLSSAVNAATQDEGELLAYSRLTGGYWQIWVRNIEGTVDYQLTRSKGDKRYPDWSHGGDRLIYRTSNGDYHIIKNDGTDRKKVLSGFGNLVHPRWSPDNKKLTFTRYRSDIKDESDIWISDINGENPLMLTNKAGFQYQSSWSQDGSKIVYVTGTAPGQHQIAVMELENKESINLMDDDTYNILPDWSPKGDEIVFVSNRSGNYDIWLMDIKRDKLRQLTKNKGFDTNPAWSPDGSSIAFTSTRSGNLQIWVMDAEGRNLQQVTGGDIECRDPAWRNERKAIQ